MSLCDICDTECGVGVQPMYPLWWVCGSGSHFVPARFPWIILCSKCCDEKMLEYIKELSNNITDVLSLFVMDVCWTISCDFCKENKPPRPYVYEDSELMEEWQKLRKLNCTCQAWDVYEAELKYVRDVFESIISFTKKERLAKL